jgi:hypothetical protein
VKQVFQTQDGELFETQDLAEKHETACFEAWLESDPNINVTAFLESLDDEHGQEWSGWTDKRIVKSYLRKCWESTQTPAGYPHMEQS